MDVHARPQQMVKARNNGGHPSWNSCSSSVIKYWKHSKTSLIKEKQHGKTIFHEPFSRAVQLSKREGWSNRIEIGREGGAELLPLKFQALLPEVTTASCKGTTLPTVILIFQLTFGSVDLVTTDGH